MSKRNSHKTGKRENKRASHLMSIMESSGTMRQVAEKIAKDSCDKDPEVGDCEQNAVVEPQHYKHGTFQVIDEMLLVFGPQRTYDFCIINAWKYRARALYKGNTEQDLEKANQYLLMAKQIAEANKELMYGCAPIRLIKYDGDKEKKVSANTYEAGLVDGYRGRMADEAAFLERSTHGSGR